MTTNPNTGGPSRVTRRLLIVDEVAELLRENPETVRRLARRHEIPGAMNIGTDRRPKWRFDATAVNRWLDEAIQ